MIHKIRVCALLVSLVVISCGSLSKNTVMESSFSLSLFQSEKNLFQRITWFKELNAIFDLYVLKIENPYEKIKDFYKEEKMFIDLALESLKNCRYGHFFIYKDSESFSTGEFKSSFQEGTFYSASPLLKMLKKLTIFEEKMWRNYKADFYCQDQKTSLILSIPYFRLIKI